MSDHLHDWNPLALRLITELFDAAAPFTAELENVSVNFTFARERVARPPSPLPPGLEKGVALHWPAPLEILAEWDGGSASLSAQTRLPGLRQLLCIEVLTGKGGRLLQLNVPACLNNAEGGISHLLALTALLKRQDNAQETEALRATLARAGLPFGPSKKVSLAKVKVPEGEFITPPQQALQNLAVLCLLKLGFYSDDERDLYQVLAYMKMVDAHHGILVYPDGAQLRSRRYRSAGPHPWEVRVLELDPVRIGQEGDRELRRLAQEVSRQT